MEVDQFDVATLDFVPLSTRLQHRHFNGVDPSSPAEAGSGEGNGIFTTPVTPTLIADGRGEEMKASEEITTLQKIHMQLRKKFYFFFVMKFDPHPLADHSVG